MKSFYKFRKGPFIAPFFIVFVLTACAGTRPLIDQSKAHSAKYYAQENGALKQSPKNYRMGLGLLRRADHYFEERRYKKAKKYYIYAKKYFEKSETRARLLNIKKGTPL